MDHGALRQIYAEYSGRDLDRLLTRVTDDVDWPDGARRIVGREAVRAYWAEQWTRTSTTDVPAVVADLADDVLVVRIDQTVRSVDGDVLSTGRFAHVLHLRGDLISRLDIVEL